MAAREAEESDEWEICNDKGFVYKRRRLNNRDQPFASASASAEAAPSNEAFEAKLRRGRRAMRRSCRMKLREKFKGELQNWKRISSLILELPKQVPVTNTIGFMKSGDGSLSTTDNQDLSRFQSIDELLAQVDSQEAILSKINEIFDHFDVICKEKEEKLFNSLMDLPIWGNPRTLFESLS